jgi:hypothetical protein
MAGKKDIWDYALRIRGTTPRAMSLLRLSEYMKAYAALLGQGNEPKFAGVVKGSVLLRASVPSERQTETRLRLLSARSAANDDLMRAHDQLADMLATDSVSGDVEDRNGAVVLEFSHRNPEPAQPEVIVQDTGIIDGVVVSLVGIDDTVHLRLLDSEQTSQKITVRDIGEARKLARHFRGDVLRVHVHGTWKRTGEGRWEAHALYLDHFEELGGESASELLNELSALEGNRWASMDDPQGELRRIRGDD